MVIKENSQTLSLGFITSKKSKLKKEMIKKSGLKNSKNMRDMEDKLMTDHTESKNKKLKKKIHTKSVNIDAAEEERVNKAKSGETVTTKKKIKKQRKVEQDEIFQENGFKPVKELKQKKRRISELDVVDSEGISQENNSEAEVEKSRKQKKRRISETDIADSGDISLSKRKKVVGDSGEQKISEDPEVKARTIFVGNVPIKCTKKDLKKHFRKYGIIESVRVRGVPAANPKLPKKVVAIKQEFHPERNNFICFIRYKNQEDAIKAENENGTLFQGHHLRVNCCLSKDKPDESKAIFIGNVNFDATEDELWKIFEICGPISHVRIIRDSYSGMGKGFAYVNFKDTDGVQLALEMEDTKLRDRVLRISLCNSSIAKKNRKMKNRKEITKPGHPRFGRRFNRRNQRADENSKDNEDFRGKKKKGNFNPNGKKSFQGSKFSDKKKTFKKNKGSLEKKKKIDMIAPKIESQI